MRPAKDSKLKPYALTLTYWLNFVKLFNLSVKVSDISGMEGLTITEIASILGIEPSAAKVRLWKAGIKPLTKEALYPREAVDAIKDIRNGRPSKKLPE
jgi:hypothetical protein